MKKAYLHLFAALSLLILFNSCEQACNACLELTTKEIKYLDSNGNNLLFGSQAIYNADSVIIKDGSDNEAHFWIQEEEGTILFSLEEMTYYIMLSDTWIDTIEFKLAERKSSTCCGNVTYSTKTFVNGQEVENNDLLIITQ